MAEWKCARCGWKNASDWTKCAKCGLELLTQEEYRILEGAIEDIKKVKLKIEQERASVASKWEYLIIMAWLDNDKHWKVFYGGETYNYDQLTAILNKLGSEGWELVGNSTSVGSEKPFMSTFTYSYTAGEKFYFKRACLAINEDLPKRLNQISEELSPKLREYLSFSG